jgi:hypothetical protein
MIKTCYLTIVLLVLCSNLLLAQASAPAWGGGADQSDLSFGFTFTYVSNSYKIVKKPDWRTPYFDPGVNHNITDSLSNIISKPASGFAIGFITRYRLTEHIEARITPSLVFADRSIFYSYDTPSQDVTKSVQTTTVDFPLEFKLKSDRIQDFRAYLLGGVKYSQAIGRGQAQTAIDPLQKNLKNVSGFGSWEAGIGCDIYFEFFKLSPEIKLSNSFGNVLLPDNEPFSSPISKLSLHSIMFSLYFE